MHRFYYSPNSCSLAPHIVIEEVGLPYLPVLVQAGGVMTNTPEWRRMNPKGRVPALSDVEGSIGGAPHLLTEVPAILGYLADTHPDARLLPGDPAGRARAAEWMNWLSGAVHAMAFGQIWREARFSDDEAVHPSIHDKGLSSLRGHYAYIESLLADGRQWALPSGYSVVDPYLLVFWRWGRQVGIDMDALPAWRDLTLRVRERPAVKAALSMCGIGVEVGGAN